MDLKLILVTKFIDSQWLLSGNDYSGLEWLDDSPKPSKKELEDLWPEVQYDSALQNIKDARHAAYTAPNGSDAVFMKYQRGEATKQEWLDAVETINSSLPYPVR